MPIFVEWEWKEKTKTFLVIFHLWKNKPWENIRTRTEKDAFETVVPIPEDYASREGEFVQVSTLPFEIDTEREYLSWAPSHPQVGLLTEVLTYANLVNGLKPEERRQLRPYLEGKTDRRTGLEVHSELLDSMPDGTMVCFARKDSVSFEIRLEYLEYLRKLLRPCLE